MKETLKIFDAFYGGIQKGDKPNIAGAVSNIEEVDIFTNKDYIQPEIIMSPDALVGGIKTISLGSGGTGYTVDDVITVVQSGGANGTITVNTVDETGAILAYTLLAPGTNYSIANGLTVTGGTGSGATINILAIDSEIYTFDIDAADTLYGYGKETTHNYVRIFSLPNAGSDNPGNWSTLFTSTAVGVKTNGIILHHEITEGGEQKKYLYYISVGNTLKRYGPLGASPAESTVGTLSGLVNATDKTWGIRLFGELYIGNGQFIAHIDDNGIFTEKKFTLPNGWYGVDAIGLSDRMLILCQNVNSRLNYSMIYQWDLVATTQFDDSITIPMGGPQWIVNHKEIIRVLCASNGIAKIYQLSGSYPIETHTIYNVATETAGQAISPVQTKTVKEGIFYFGIYKTDKTGIYALGQVDEGKPVALVLSKRFDTTDYSKHKPIALFIIGQNFYAVYNDDGINRISRCEGNNSPTRSSNAVMETIWYDAGDPIIEKDIANVYLVSYELPTNTSLKLYLAKNHGSYSEVKQPNGTNFNNGEYGFYKAEEFKNLRNIKIKVAFTSNGTFCPKLKAIGLHIIIKDYK